MRRPSITDYIGTLENPTEVFRTLGEIGIERNIYGEVNLRSGNSAAIFTCAGGGGNGGARRFLKCYIRPNPHLRTIYAYIETHRPPLLPEIKLLPDELYVLPLAGDTGWVDVVEGEWTDGETLNMAIARATKTGERQKLHALAGAFDDLCRTLLAEEWAHGDLKPENIIVRPDGTLTLIDCDAMWIPSLAGHRAAELGTPAYRHPQRTAEHFDKLIDDYPMALISASLHALALVPALYAKYNTPDILLLSPPEIVRGTSAAHSEMLEIFAQAGLASRYRMTEALAAPFPGEVDATRFFAPLPAGTPAAPRTPLGSFVERGKWGFADKNGAPVIPPFWDEALEFRGGRAKVRLAGYWHTIDATGNISGKKCSEKLHFMF